MCKCSSDSGFGGIRDRDVSSRFSCPRARLVESGGVRPRFHIGPQRPVSSDDDSDDVARVKLDDDLLDINLGSLDAANFARRRPIDGADDGRNPLCLWRTNAPTHAWTHSDCEKR